MVRIPRVRAIPPKKGLSNGKENGQRNGSWAYMGRHKKDNPCKFIQLSEYLLIVSTEWSNGSLK